MKHGSPKTGNGGNYSWKLLTLIWNGENYVKFGAKLCQICKKIMYNFEKITSKLKKITSKFEETLWKLGEFHEN